MQFLRFRKLEGVNLELDSADATVFDDSQNRMMRTRPWRKMMGSLSHTCNPNQLPHHDDCLLTSTMSLKAFTEVSCLIQEWHLSCGLCGTTGTHGRESQTMWRLSWHDVTIANWKGCRVVAPNLCPIAQFKYPAR
jgi:hypothetical protein